MNDFFKLAHRMGIFFVIWFAICFAWYFIRPVDQALQLQLYRISFFYFTKMNLMGIISGTIQSYLFGYVVAGTWVLASKITCCKK